jgi:serpin B
MKPISRITAILLLFILAGAGCAQNNDDPVFDYNLKSARVIETNNQFGLELLQTVLENEQQPNIMISPASVSIALGMAYNGAGSTTMEAFEQVLNYEGLTREEVNEITKELINVLVTNVKGNLLEIANSIWYREGFPVKQEFTDLNANYLDAEVRALDFSTADALKTINNWVSEMTYGKIDEVIQEIDPSVMMILINAIYFNCVWEVEFDPKDTRQEPFYSESGEEVGKVEMMKLERTFNVSFGEGYGAVELPYKNNKFSMFLFLPAEGVTLDELVAGLDGEQWKAWMEAFHKSEEFTVLMPKFRFEFERSIADDLKAMGLEVAFSDGADFSGISEVPLLISDVIHKTYIDVNEKGTEAAAVTVIVMRNTSVGPPTVLRLDRPFLFAITENSSKSILFIGRVGKPEYPV